MFKNFLDKKSFKYTYERKCIYNEIEIIDKHFDADQLYERFKKRDERISRATVYRTLPLLLEAGVIQKSTGEKKRDFFESIRKEGHHDHIVCLDCGKIIEFCNETIEREQEILSKKYHFKISFHDHKIFGYCSNCK